MSGNRISTGGTVSAVSRGPNGEPSGLEKAVSTAANNDVLTLLSKVLFPTVAVGFLSWLALGQIDQGKLLAGVLSTVASHTASFNDLAEIKKGLSDANVTLGQHTEALKRLPAIEKKQNDADDVRDAITKQITTLSDKVDGNHQEILQTLSNNEKRRNETLTRRDKQFDDLTTQVAKQGGALFDTQNKVTTLTDRLASDEDRRSSGHAH